MVNRERDDNVYYARLAEQGERYEDMIRYMKEVAAVSMNGFGSWRACNQSWLIEAMMQIDNMQLLRCLFLRIDW